MILYQGLLASPASWARVGRGYLSALLEKSLDVAAVKVRGFRFDPDFSTPAGLRWLSVAEARNGTPPEIGLGFLHPPHVNRLVGRLKANLFVWEADRVPQAWIEPLRRHTDLVIVPSSFTRDALIDSGMPASQTALVPYGFEPPPLTTRPPSAEQRTGSGEYRFAFLSVVAPHWRKGVRELLQAYRRAFDKQDDVMLIIKSTYDPANSRRRRPFEIPSWNELIDICGLHEPNAPTVALRLDTISDSEMHSLYANSNVYVAPSWGESFGLAILDALARGIPVIVTNWSGHTEFVPPGPDLVSYSLTTAGEQLYTSSPNAQFAIPEIEAIAERMRWHYEHPGESAALGLAGRSAVSHLTWANAAQQLMDVLQRARDS